MYVLQAIRYIIKSWNEVTAKTIYNCQNHVGILSDNNKTDNESDDQLLNELSKTIKAFNLPNAMQIKEFLNIPEEDITYEILDDDQIIEKLVDIFKKSDENTDDLDEGDNGIEIANISINVALKSIETVNMFLLQQNDDTNECIKLVNTVEKFIKRKKVSMMQQTTIDYYFN